MISVFDISPGLNLSDAFAELAPLLPVWRLQKALSYKFDLDRFLCAKSYLMLENMLRTGYGITSCPEFSYGPDGKPYLPGNPGIRFNMSHCARGIVCAVSDRDVGVDIEVIQYDSLVAEHVLNGEELAEVAAAVSPAEKFTELWTRKESFLKLTGEGLVEDMKGILRRTDGVRFDTVVNREAGYVRTLCRFSQPR